MLLSEEGRVISGLAVMAGVFLVGEATGFASADYASLWPWAAAVAVWLGMTLGAWRVRGTRFLMVFLAGVVLAGRTEKNLADVRQWALTRPMAGPPVWELAVETRPTVRNWTRKGVAWMSFASHLGPLPVDVMMPVADEAVRPHKGDVWKCAGWLSWNKDAVQRYRRRTLWVMRPEETHCLKKSGREGPSLLERMAADFLRRADRGLGWCPEIAALNRAILLGKRSDLSRTRKETFIAAGTVHVFAISGLHVMLVAHIVMGLLHLVPMPERWRGVVALVPVIVYVVLTGMRPSAVRAAWAAGFYLVAPVFHRRPDALAAWALTVFLVYGLHPEELYDVGCSFSFAVMLGIVVWVKWVRAFELPTWTMRFFHDRWTVALADLLVTLVAWATGVPIAAHVFGRFTWGGLLANIPVLVCAAGTVAFGVAGVAFSYVSVTLGVAFNLLAAACTYGMMTISRIVARLPHVAFDVAPWSGLECAAWYGSFILLLMVAERLLPHRVGHSEKWW